MNEIIAQFKKSVLGGNMTDLSQIAWPVGLKVLVLAPHSDDFDAVAVTLGMLHKRGCILCLAVLCLDNGVDADFEPQTRQAEIRKREQLASLAFFGLPVNDVTFPETSCDETGQVTDCPHNRKLIAEIFEKFQPDLVFSPHWNDTNSAHRYVAAILHDLQAKYPKFLAFHNHDPKTTAMVTNAFMPFDENKAAWKSEMLRHHVSQHMRNLRSRGSGFDERLLADNRNSAKTVNSVLEYAEIFEIRTL